MKRILLGGGADHHSRSEGREQERIAVDDRQRVGHLSIERQPHGGGIKLHGDRRCFHGDRFIGIADFRPRVDSDIAAGLHEHVLLHEGAKARQFHGDGIRARQHQIEQIGAGAVAGLRGPDTGLSVDQRYSAVNDDCARGIHNAGLHAGARILCKQQGACQTQKKTTSFAISDILPLPLT
jgi:hypothetical protein